MRRLRSVAGALIDALAAVVLAIIILPFILFFAVGGKAFRREDELDEITKVELEIMRRDAESTN